MDYGSYRTSQFVVELNRNIVVPGDFHRYLFMENAEGYIRHPGGTKDDPISIINGSPLDEAADDSEDVLISMNSIFHEVTHLVQDYSVGSEMLRDMLGDSISVLSYGILNERGKWGMDSELPLIESLKNNISTDLEVNRLIEQYKVIYESYTLVKLEDDEGNFEIPISTDDLLEAYAAARSYYLMITVETIEYKESDLNSRFFINNLSEAYKRVWRIYKRFCRFEEKNYSGRKMTQNLQNELNGFLLLCDISLHIPPFLNDESGNGINGVPKCCIPFERFISAIFTLNKNGGFPDAVKGTDFYITLYDLIATDNGWPIFKDVADSWKNLLRSRMYYRFMISDLYRFLVLNYKGQKPNGIIFENLKDVFASTGIPVLVRYYDNERETSFFEYVHIWKNNCAIVMDDMPISPMRDPWIIMKNYYNEWDYPTLLNKVEKEGYKHVLELTPAFLREIYCRIIYKAFFRAIMEKNGFCCPLEQMNCQVKMKSCKCLKKLATLPENCCLKIWMDDLKINPHYVYWR